MGGIGSSRWQDHVRKRLVTEAMKIDLRDPQWKSLLAIGRAEGTLNWSDSRTGSPSGWADFVLSPVDPDGVRNLVLLRAEDEFEPREVVSLALRPAGFCAHWFAGCRGCDRWVRMLYAMNQHERFKCRACSNLTYWSVQKHDARLDFAKRDLAGFLASRAKAPQTVRSRAVTGFLVADAEGWGRRSTTNWSRMADRMRQDYIDRWGFPPEDAGRIARGG
jgi:hypothetical protein